MTDRIHRFEGLENFRDFGDYDAAAGWRIARGRLFRSAHPGRATEADLQRLAGLGIGAVVDLRRAGERREQPGRRPAGWAGRVIETYHDAGAEAPHIAFLKSSELTVASARAFMERTYRDLPFDPVHLDLFGRYFRAVGESATPVLIHCAAGKDRTGLLAALTHRLLGVHRDDMIADYLLTNTALDLSAQAPAIARRIEAFTGRPAPHEAVVAFLGVEADWLQTALDAIAERYGSLDVYLDRALGVDARLRDRIGEHLCA